MEGKVAVLGDADFVMPFKALGLDIYPVEDNEKSIQEKADEIVSGKYALVIIAENIYPTAEDSFASVRDKATPCITVVPFTTESKGYATQALGEILRMATGINILQSN